MKTKKEKNTPEKETTAQIKKLNTLSDKELESVTGGLGGNFSFGCDLGNIELEDFKTISRDYKNQYSQ